jgi:hypothetical protein
MENPVAWGGILGIVHAVHVKLLCGGIQVSAAALVKHDTAKEVPHHPRAHPSCT